MRNPFSRAQAPAGDQPAGITPTPLTIRLVHIDRELTKFAAMRPRTETVLRALDYWLDRRLEKRPGGEGGS
jgi:hypothetical protein